MSTLTLGQRVDALFNAKVPDDYVMDKRCKIFCETLSDEEVGFLVAIDQTLRETNRLQALGLDIVGHIKDELKEYVSGIGER